MTDSSNVQGRIKSQGVCQLCGEDRELQDSHVLPAFVFRWLRETSGNGHIRSSANPNLRVQDGLKHDWLCATCEGAISVFEGVFAEKLFRPYLADPTRTLRYRDWLTQFCISVSWRVLLHFKSIDDLGRFSENKRAAISEAAQVWRECLLGRRPHPDQFQQHILPVDRVASTTAELAPNINRYLMRAVDMDLCQGEDIVFTYAKLGRFLIIGFVNEPNPNRWRGTKVHASEGTISTRKYVVPASLLEYLNNKANRAGEAMQRVSEVQHEKIDKSFKKSAASYVGSDAFEAMRANVERFGDAAFIRNKFRNEKS